MKIIIDAGHGPHTPGKRSPDGMREFEFNQETALFLKPLLPGDVQFVHHNKRDVPLQERVRKANNAKADLYVSIHANAFGTGWSSAQGIETYIHSSRPAKAMAIAQAVQHELIHATGRRSRGVKTADFYVLRHTQMSAILVEAGFMTHREEARLLRTASYRKTCALAIATAVKQTCF